MMKRNSVVANVLSTQARMAKLKRDLEKRNLSPLAQARVDAELMRLERVVTGNR